MNRRVACLTLAMLSGSTSPLFLSGCGDDTGTTPPSDSGADGLADSTIEASPDAAPDQTTPADATIDQTVVETGSDAGIDSGACTPFDASGLDDASVQEGKLEVWTVYKCQGCHQRATQTVDDAGNGLVLSGNNDGIGDSGMVFPPNLTSDPATGIGCWTDMQIANAILMGVDNEGKMLCPSMPRFGMPLTSNGAPRPGTPMDAGTAQQIVDFLRSLPMVSNQVTQTTCPMLVQDGGSEAAADGGAEASDGAAEAAVDGGEASSDSAAEAAADSGGTDANTDAAEAGDGATE